MRLFCFFRFQSKVLLCIEPDILQHQDLPDLHCMHRIPGMFPENTVYVGNGLVQKLFKFFSMGFQRCEVLLPRPALVSDNYDTAA